MDDILSSKDLPHDGEAPHRLPGSRRRPRPGWPAQRLVWQVGLAAAFLLAWELLPKIPLLAGNIRLFDVFYISSPSRIADSLVKLMGTDPGTGVSVWPYLWTTVSATVLGTVVGLLLGALAGLIFSNSLRLSEVVRPFIVLANSVPRVAIIPISVVFFGPNLTASVFNVITVVFFIGFFNAFEGGRSIRPALVDNARLLGASSFSVMRTIRLPMVLMWTFASVPNAISFGLIVSVTTELLAGVPGMGLLLQVATSNIRTDTTFAIIVILSIVGLLLYGAAVLIRGVALRWEKAM